MLSHNYHEALARQIGICWRRTADDVVWTPLPLFHFNAIVTAVLGPLVYGGRAAIYRRFSVSNFWPEMNRTGATITSTLGTMAYLLAHDVDRPEMPRSGAPEANTSLRSSARRRCRSRSTTSCVALRDRDVQRRVRRDRGGLVVVAAAGRGEQAQRRRHDQRRVLRRPHLRRRRQRAAARHRGRDRGPPEAAARDVRGLLGPPRGDGRDQPQPVVPHRRHRPDRRRGLPLLRRPQGRLPPPPRREHLELRGRAHPHAPRRLADVAVHAVPSELTEDDLKVTATLDGGRSSPRRSCSAGASTSSRTSPPRYIEFRPSCPAAP